MTATKLIYPVGNYSIFLLQDSDQSPNLACAALLILLVLTLVLNSFVLFSVLWSPLRSTTHNASIAVITGVSLIDGVFNMTSSVVFHASWMELPHLYGDDTVRVWCRSNAAVLQFTGVGHSFALAILSYDRLSTDGRTPLRVPLKWILVLSVVGSIVLTFPVAFGALFTTLFQQRMSCGPAYVTKQPEGVLIATVILSVYVTTWCLIVRNSYVIVKKRLNNRRRLAGLELVARQRAVERGSPQRVVTTSKSDVWCHWGTENGEGLLTGLLITAFMLTVVPNITVVQVTQFYNANNTPQELYMINQTLPQVITDVYDSIFAWTHHGYNVFSPGVILLLHSEIRRQCQITFCCCVAGGNTHIPQQSRSVPAFVRRKKKTVADCRTPVLFATSEGLHLRTIRGDPLQEGEPQFIVRFCDVTLDDSVSSEQQIPVEVRPRQNLKLNETFVVRQEVRSFGETFVKSSQAFDPSESSRNRSIELV